jgi:hypothetical protein
MDASARIDGMIAVLADWRGETLAHVRALINGTGLCLIEEWKWNTGVWMSNGKLVCGIGAFKEHVKINFFNGAVLADSTGLFNSGTDAKAMRAIDLRQGDILDEVAFADLLRQAAALATVK